MSRFLIQWGQAVQELSYRPDKWLGSIVQWLLYIMMLTICIKPLDMLEEYQKAGLIWLILVSNILQDIQRYWDWGQIVDEYELHYFAKAQRNYWWQYRLAALWTIQSICCVTGLWIVQVALALAEKTVFYLCILWLILSPFYYLLWLLQRLVALGSRYGNLINLVLIVPWILPTILFIHELLIAHALGQRIWGYFVLLAGISLLSIAWLPKVIDRTMQEVYWRMRCQT